MKTAILKKQIIHRIEHLDDPELLEEVARLLDLEDEMEDSKKGKTKSHDKHKDIQKWNDE